MSVDGLQEKIRKRKSALTVDMTLFPGQLPECYAEKSFPEGYRQYCLDLMKCLKGQIPAVRFRLSALALLGVQMLEILPELTKRASELGFYVLLEAPELGNRETAELAGAALLGLNGTRLVHMAAADRVSRYADSLLGKFGYARVGIAASAGAPDSLKNLRAKYGNLFLLADGLDYPSANLKHVSYAFDKLGRGAAYCAGAMVTQAWRQAENADPIEAAQAEVERQKKGLQRYITFL